MKTEENLLAREWRRISSQLRNVLWLHADPVVTALVQPGLPPAAFDPPFATFVGSALKDMESRRNLAGGHHHAERAHQTWEVAISLMGESAILKQALWDGRKFFATGDPQIAFHMVARRALSTMRWPQLADSPGQLKTWERLDRISRELAAEGGNALKDTFSRCTREHLEALLARLGETHAHDHNLPREMHTLENYFFRFCTECVEGARADLDDSDGADAAEMDGSDVALLPGYDRRADFLHACIGALEGLYRDVILATLRRPDSDNVVFLTAEAFCNARNVSRRKFFQFKDAAMQQLKLCIRRKEENDE